MVDRSAMFRDEYVMVKRTEALKKSVDRVADEFNYDSYKVFTRVGNQDAKSISKADYPLKATGGTTDGLQVIIKKDPNLKILEICQFPSFIVHSHFELPESFDDFKFYQHDFGKTFDVLITPKVIVTDKALVSVAPEKRNCYFDGERELKFYKIYTKVNCEMECYAEYLHRTINCTPYYLPREESSKFCDLVDIKFLIIATNSSEMRQCNCLNNCNSINYEVDVFWNLLSSKSNES
jgi:amiloride-sensitive sodium channel